MRLARWFAATLLVSVAAAGCTAGPTDKSGGSGGVRTLTLASPESPGRPGSLDVEYFVDQVESRSDGRLRVEVTWEVGFDQPSWDQVTADQVIDGTVDLGFVPGRAWDVLGVTTLQAIHAPFVVTSDAALDAVVADPVAEDMLAGLSELGVTGLGLFAEGLRHPASFGEPLLEPADFAGAGIRTPRSDLSWSIMRALGAEPLDPSGVEEAALFEDGSLAGAETSAAYLPSLPRPGVMTANVTPYPKVNVLVANTAALAGLSDDERGVLEAAAADALAHSIGTRRSDALDVASLCEQGLAVVFADDDQLTALRAATGPVRDRLAADPTTGPLLARISAIVEGTDPPDPVASCADAGSAAASDVDLAAYDGVWRFEVTYQDGVEAGLPADRAGAELGVQTVRLDGGAFRWDWRSARGEQSCAGTYTVADGLLTFREDQPCGAVWDARPQVVEDQITWTEVRTGADADDLDQILRELLHSVPWERIEDVPDVDLPPDGVYRWAVDEADLVAAGIDGGTAYHNSGLMTMTLEGGRWLHHTESAAAPPDCGGGYAVEGTRVAFTADDDDPDCGGAALVFAGRWDSTDDGIAFTDLQPATPFSDVMWGTPWRRIG